MNVLHKASRHVEDTVEQIHVLDFGVPVAGQQLNEVVENQPDSRLLNANLVNQRLALTIYFFRKNLVRTRWRQRRHEGRHD